MAFPRPAAVYRDFQWNKLGQKAYRHLWCLLFWPLLGLRYILVERFVIPEQYFEVYCLLDDRIPFYEGFVIPYVLWYILIVGMHLYTVVYDIPAFKRYSRYLFTAFTLSTLIFLLFPTCQNLRPVEFPRENFLTNVVRILYFVDTNTNVCPSEHVIGSMAAFLAAIQTKSLRKPAVLIPLGVVAALASIATVFLKQHSVIDVAAAIPICVITFFLCRIGEKDS